MSRDALSASHVATATAIAGAVGLAGGAVLWWTTKPASSPRRGVAVRLGWGNLLVGTAW